MPRPKINIYMSFKNDKDRLVVKSVKADYNKEYDCYFININDLAPKFVSTMSLILHWLCFEKYGTKYYCTNLFLEKIKNDVNIKLVFEKAGYNQFYKEENAVNVFKNIEFFTLFASTKKDEMFELYRLCRDNNLIKSTYINGIYMMREGQRLDFAKASVHIDTYSRLSKIMLHKKTEVVATFIDKNMK